MTKTSIHAFRVWDAPLREYRENNSDQDLSINMLGELVIDYYSQIYNKRVQLAVVNGERFIVERFTGFTDKNGRDIYEGDLITHSNSELPHCVSINIEAGAIAQYSNDDTSIKLMSILRDIEVVGTVHDVN